jgi:hypothetical protein
MKKIRFLFITLLLLSALAACQATPASDSPGDHSQPETPLSQSEPTTAPPGPYSLGSVSFKQSGTAPDYTIEVAMPVMNGSDDPHVVNFNKAVSQVVQQEVDTFKKSLEELPAAPISAGSYFAIHHVPILVTGNIVSLQLKVETYADGAAHPFDYTVTFNYDLDKGELALADLFKPGANYLQALADYCTTELNKTDLASVLSTDGLRPTAENYRNWNMTADGLVITFNEYQVAPYAAGPQTVVVPYAALKDLINPDGPLADFTK